jgi:hypothetical protein
MIIYVNIKTNVMNYRVVESREIVWSEENDRHILIVREDNEVVGLNYCQGDELEYFKEHFFCIDYDLTDFYNSVKRYLDYLTYETEVDKINAAIWAHFDYKNRQDEREE